MRGIRVVGPPEIALTALVEERGRWLVQCAYLLTRDREQSLDLTQETLLRAWRGWDKVSAADEPERYMLRIMMNLFRDKHRRSRAPEFTLDSLEAQRSGARQAADFTTTVIDADVVATAISLLSQRQRAVIVLRHWADYSDESIADVLGCRRATVRSLAARGLKVIERHLGEDQP